MEQYLKDSPSDYNNYDPNNSESQNSANPSNGNNFQNSQYNGQQASGNYAPDNNFSLNIEQPYNPDEVEGQPYQNTGGPDFFGVGTNMANEPDFSSSYNNDPFLDDLDSLAYPTQTVGNPASPPFNLSQPPQTANLDELISPNNQPSVLDSQYFSPPGRQSVNLNSLNHESYTSNNNTFSPNLSRHGSVSAPFQNTNNYDVNTGSYLSPQPTNFMSPGSTHFENSLDKLRSPNFGSYLNSPPQYNPHNTRNISGKLTSTSIPASTNNFLSPPTNTNTLGTSAPGGNGSMADHSNNHNIPAKQLSKEEKLKRRREFHNAVERRRRDLIKERIKELGLLVPPSLLNPQLVAVQTFQNNSKLNSKETNDLLASVKVKESKPNKSTILNKSVEYVQHLEYVLEQQQKTRASLEQKIKALQIAPEPEPSPDIGTNFDSTNSFDPNAFDKKDPNNNANFLQDFQNQSQSQYVKDEQSFNPDEFFLEIITGNDDNNFRP